jgi:predicted dehydrogenase
LRAVVVGAGWAGEGHTRALRQVGVDVVAICGRDPDAVDVVAGRLEIPEASTDWRETITRVRPDVVTIATPASLRGEVVEVVASLGCHVFGEKPLALTSEDAWRLVQIVENARVKHAFGHTHAVHPSVDWVGELVRGGAIGRLRAVDASFHLGHLIPPLFPWSWIESLALGGGLLNNIATHWLGMLETMTGRRVARIVGAAQPGRERAPVVPDIHDVRALWTRVPTEAEANNLEWRACDADMSFSALAALSEPGASARDEVIGHLTATFNLAPVWPPSGWRLYGDDGVLLIDEPFAPIQVVRQRSREAERESLPIPPEVRAATPNTGDALVDMWTILFREFVADIRGDGRALYPTFRDGWRLQVALDAIRSGSGWTEIPAGHIFAPS